MHGAAALVRAHTGATRARTQGPRARAHLVLVGRRLADGPAAEVQDALELLRGYVWLCMIMIILCYDHNGKDALELLRGGRPGSGGCRLEGAARAYAYAQPVTWA